MAPSLSIICVYFSFTLSPFGVQAVTPRTIWRQPSCITTASMFTNTALLNARIHRIKSVVFIGSFVAHPKVREIMLLWFLENLQHAVVPRNGELATTWDCTRRSNQIFCETSRIQWLQSMRLSKFWEAVILSGSHGWFTCANYTGFRPVQTSTFVESWNHDALKLFLISPQFPVHTIAINWSSKLVTVSHAVVILMITTLNQIKSCFLQIERWFVCESGRRSEDSFPAKLRLHMRLGNLAPELGDFKAG